MIYPFLILPFFFLTFALTVSSPNFPHLSKLLDTVDDTFPLQFQKIDPSTLSPSDLGHYTCLYGRAHLYGMLSTPSDILTGFSFIKIASQHFEIPQCMHILGIMYNFKMTPYFNLQQSPLNNSILEQYLKRSHLKNSEMFWYLASLKQYMPSTMILGNLNHVGLSTKLNCTTAATYYRMIIQKIFIQEYEAHGYYRDRNNMFQQELYLKEKIQFSDEADESYMIQESLNLGQESFSSNMNIAQNYYYGRNGFLRNVTKAAEMFERLKEVGISQSASLLGLCYFKGEGVKKNYQKAYELFKSSKNQELSRYMLNVMELYGIHVKKNKQAVIKRLKNEIREYAHSKGLYGALILKGQVPEEEKMKGMMLLQESSNYGFSVSKLMLGITFLDGIDIAYNCPKGIGLIREGLMSIDVWSDKTEEAKKAIKKGKYMFALMKYLELSLTGSSSGLVNGLFLLEIYLKQLTLDNWNADLISANPFFQHLQTRLPSLAAESLLFSDILTLTSSASISDLLLNSSKNYIQYVRHKLLTICKNGGVSICMFLSYKSNPTNKGLLKQLSKRQGEKLHLLESRFLLGQYYQSINETQLAVEEYSKATSQLLGPVMLMIEGYRFEMGIWDDLVVMVMLVAVGVAVGVVHRNMLVIRKHKEEKEKEEREEREKEEREEREQEIIEQEKEKEGKKEESVQKEIEKRQALPNQSPNPSDLPTPHSTLSHQKFQ